MANLFIETRGCTLNPANSGIICVLLISGRALARENPKESRTRRIGRRMNALLAEKEKAFKGKSINYQRETQVF